MTPVFRRRADPLGMTLKLRRLTITLTDNYCTLPSGYRLRLTSEQVAMLIEEAAFILNSEIE